MSEIRVTRKDLYDLVWSEPMLSLSKKYKISDNGLRKICKRMNIPLPKAGHWMKLQFGKKVRIIPFPESFEGEATITLSLRTDDEKKDTESLSFLTKQIKNDPALSLIVPDKLSHPDKLIIEARQHLTSKDTFIYQGMVSRSRDGLDIKVTPKNINRALLFMDTLIKALRARKHEIILKNGFTYASIKEQEFRICFREKTKRVIVPGKHYDSSEYHPVNILYFKYDGYSSKEWKDGKQPLENYLPEIVSKLEIASAELTAEQENHRKYFEEIERKRQAVIDAQQLKENELSEFKDLLVKAERWHKVNNLRNYLAAVEKTIGQNDAPERIKSWLEWSHKKADWYDPMIEGEDDLLKDVDRGSLSFKR